MFVREVGGGVVCFLFGGIVVVILDFRIVGAIGSRGGGYIGGYCSGVEVFFFFLIWEGLLNLLRMLFVI